MVSDTWRDVRGSDARALMVGPVPFTPFDAQVIVDAGDHYETGTFSWWPTAVASIRDPVPKNAGASAGEEGTGQAPQIRDFLVWARFPFWTITPEKDGTRVTVGDVRFMSQLDPPRELPGINGRARPVTRNRRKRR